MIVETEEVAKSAQKPRAWSSEDVTRFAEFLMECVFHDRRRIPVPPRPRFIEQCRLAAPGWTVDHLMCALKINGAEHPSNPKSYAWFLKVIADVYQLWDGTPPDISNEAVANTLVPLPLMTFGERRRQLRDQLLANRVQTFDARWQEGTSTTNAPEWEETNCRRCRGSGWDIKADSYCTCPGGQKKRRFEERAEKRKHAAQTSAQDSSAV